MLSSPVGIHTTTTGSTHQHSGEHHAMTSQGHTSVASNKSLFVTAKEAIRWYAHKAGMRLVAAKEDIHIQALRTNIHLLVKIKIEMQAQEIILSAQDEIEFQGGTSYINYQASGVQELSAGVVLNHAGGHPLVIGAGEAAPKLEESGQFPTKFSEQFRMVDERDEPLVNAKYVLQSETGKTWEGVTDKDGFTSRIYTEKPMVINIIEVTRLTKTERGN